MVTRRAGGAELAYIAANRGLACVCLLSCSQFGAVLRRDCAECRGLPLQRPKHTAIGICRGLPLPAIGICRGLPLPVPVLPVVARLRQGPGFSDNPVGAKSRGRRSLKQHSGESWGGSMDDARNQKKKEK